MPTFTVLNDIHLKPAYADLAKAVTLPPETDAIVIAGDLLDRDDDESIAKGRRVLARFDDSPVPTAVVPGNHDPLGAAERLAEGFDSVQVAHERRLTGVDFLGPAVAFDRIALTGIGCTQFDAGVEIDYEEATAFTIRDGHGYVDRYRQAEAICELLSAVDDLVAGDHTARDVRKALGLPPSAIGDLRAVADRARTLVDLLTGEPTLLASHVPPFGTDLDVHHSMEDRAENGLHAGWLAVAAAIRAASPPVAVVGHSHIQGYDTYDDHPTHILNGGFRGVTTVDIGDDGFSFSFHRPDWLPGGD